MQTQAFPKSRQDNIVMQDLGHEILLYDLTTHKAFSLNETSSLIWRECDGRKSIPEITQIISQKLKTPASNDLVWMAIDDLKKEDLLENDADLVSSFKGVSRREVIRKVGLGTMIALPIISTLVAPLPAMSQSVTGECSNPSHCVPPNFPSGFECCVFSIPIPNPGNPPTSGPLQGFCFDPQNGDCGVTN